MTVSRPRLGRERFDAVLFDLDGVLTATAQVHAACWKRLFDDYLARHVPGAPPFDLQHDYTRYVDGKPRYDGVRSFLASRAIHLPEGTPDDLPGDDTVCALGNRKNALVTEAIARDGVEVYPGAVALLRQLRRQGIKTAVVSSSHNCRAVLEAAGITDLLDVRVDGGVAVARGLAGKPAPDTFLAAARDLGVAPARAAVVEDAIAGVEAGRDGGFGLVVGVDRAGDPDRLTRHGAHVVVTDLAALLPDA